MLILNLLLLSLLALAYPITANQFNPDHCKEIAKEYCYLANHFMQADKKDKAVDFYLKAASTDPNNFDAHYNLGIIYRDLEQLENAAEHYQKAHTLQPDNLNLIMDLANVYNMLDKNEESLVLYEKIVEKNPNAISALYNFGFTLKKMGMLKEALEIYTKENFSSH